MKKIFLAINIPISPECNSQIDTLHRNFNFMKIRWVEPQYMHLTLKYFGPTDDSTIAKIIDILEGFLSSQTPFALQINRLAMFGSKGAPRVLWLGIEEEEMLKELVHNIQKKLNKLGLYSDNQNFVPHISIGRIIKTNSNSFFQKQIKKFQYFPQQHIEIKSVALLESIISNSGVEYRVVKEF